MLVSCTVTAPRRWRLFFVDFLVRMWRLNAWPRLTVPPGRTRKRFFAPLLVFILGMIALLLSFVLVRRRGVFPRLDGPEPLVCGESSNPPLVVATRENRHFWGEP